MTFIEYVLVYLGVSYAIGAFWFLFLERKDGFLKWRTIAAVLAPLAVPVLAMLFISLGFLEKAFDKKKAVKLKNNESDR